MYHLIRDSATQNIIWFRITDTSSNQNQTLPTVIKVDTEWPQIISAIDLNATIFSGNETINFTVTNKIGPVQVWYNWNNGNNISLTSPYNITLPIEPGIYNLTIYAVNQIGHLTVNHYVINIAKPNWYQNPWLWGGIILTAAILGLIYVAMIVMSKNRLAKERDIFIPYYNPM